MPTKGSAKGPDRLEEVFHLIDANNDNDISFAEAKDFTDCLPEPIDDKDLRRFFDEADQDGSGGIDRQEFRTMLVRIQLFTGVQLPQMVQLFKKRCYSKLFDCVDEDESGLISPDEMLKLVLSLQTQLGLKITDSEVRRVKLEMGQTLHDDVNRDTFVEIVMRVTENVPISHVLHACATARQASKKRLTNAFEEFFQSSGRASFVGRPAGSRPRASTLAPRMEKAGSSTSSTTATPSHPSPTASTTPSQQPHTTTQPPPPPPPPPPPQPPPDVQSAPTPPASPLVHEVSSVATSPLNSPDARPYPDVATPPPAELPTPQHPPQPEMDIATPHEEELDEHEAAFLETLKDLGDLGDGSEGEAPDRPPSPPKPFVLENQSAVVHIFPLPSLRGPDAAARVERWLSSLLTPYGTLLGKLVIALPQGYARAAFDSACSAQRAVEASASGEIKSYGGNSLTVQYLSEVGAAAEGCVEAVEDDPVEDIVTTPTGDQHPPHNVPRLSREEDAAPLSFLPMPPAVLATPTISSIMKRQSAVGADGGSIESTSPARALAGPLARKECARGFTAPPAAESRGYRLRQLLQCAKGPTWQAFPYLTKLAIAQDGAARSIPAGTGKDPSWLLPPWFEGGVHTMPPLPRGASLSPEMPYSVMLQTPTSPPVVVRSPREEVPHSPRVEPPGHAEREGVAEDGEEPKGCSEPQQIPPPVPPPEDLIAMCRKRQEERARLRTMDPSNVFVTLRDVAREDPTPSPPIPRALYVKASRRRPVKDLVRHFERNAHAVPLKKPKAPQPTALPKYPPRQRSPPPPPASPPPPSPSLGKGGTERGGSPAHRGASAPRTPDSLPSHLVERQGKTSSPYHHPAVSATVPVSHRSVRLDCTPPLPPQQPVAHHTPPIGYAEEVVSRLSTGTPMADGECGTARVSSDGTPDDILDVWGASTSEVIPSPPPPITVRGIDEGGYATTTIPYGKGGVDWEAVEALEARIDERERHTGSLSEPPQTFPFRPELGASPTALDYVKDELRRLTFLALQSKQREANRFAEIQHLEQELHSLRLRKARQKQDEEWAAEKEAATKRLHRDTALQQTLHDLLGSNPSNTCTLPPAM